MKVRTRVAPSPTGDPHLGTAYVALFNWAFAKKHGGSFILRIEDTDQVRSTKGSEGAILESLKWLGLDWDEGPDCGGELGPYRQSERKNLYIQYANELVSKGKAFHCFCSAERLNQLRADQRARKETTRYDGHCLGLTESEIEERKRRGESSVIRLAVPEEGESVFTDLLRGEIKIPYQQVDMQVLIKADGMPTYHMAVVVDDHLMEISHVIRGEEWINSVPKHKLLYEYFGWPMPELIHLPLLRNPDQSKLSKRKNPTSIGFYRDSGFLPKALVNYLCLMGWSMPDERDLFDLEEMVSEFDENRISTGGPIFDLKKLSWINGQYIRNLSHDDFVEELIRQMANPEKINQIVPLIRDRIERFDEVIGKADYLLGAIPGIGSSDFEFTDLPDELVSQILYIAVSSLEQLEDWQKDTIFDLFTRCAKYLDIDFKKFMKPIFVAISGKRNSLPAFDSMAIMGKSVTISRFRTAMDEVGLSGKKRKKFEKEMADFFADS